MNRLLSFRPLLGVAAVIAVLLVVTLQASLINQESLQRSASAQGPQNVQVNNLANDAVQGLAGITAASNLSDRYYSPGLKLTFTYDPELMSLSEQTPGMIAVLRGDAWNGIAQVVTGTNWSQVRARFLRDNEHFWHTSKVVDDQELGDTRQLVIEARTPGLLNNVELVERFSVLAKSVGQSYVFVVLRQNVQTDVAPTAVVEQYQKLLQTAVVGNQLPSGERRVGLSGNAFTITYDPQVWTTLARQEYRTILQFNLPVKGTANTKVIIDTQTLTNPRAPTQLQGDVDTLLHAAERNWSKNSFKILNIPKKTMIGGQEFFFVRYQYTTALRNQLVISEYQGYYGAKRLLVQLRTEEDRSDSAGSREIERLLESIQFSDDAAVLGASSQAEIPKATVLGKPAVVHIFNRSCIKVTIPRNAQLPNASGRQYDLCSAGLGTGFYVNKHGYVITNAHVSAPNPIDVAVNGVSRGYDPSELRSKLAADSVLLLRQQYPDIDFFNAAEDQRVRLMIQNAMITLMVYGIQQKQFTLSTPEYTSYLQTGKPFEVNSRDLSLRNNGEQLATTMIAKREIDSFYSIALSLLQNKKAGITTPDLALLQVRDPKGEYPAITLAGQQEVVAGQSIYVIGFPGVADNATLFGTQSQVIPTVTKGTVSAVKGNFSDTFKLVQIDASIAPGNSGGPIINADGKLLGVATYGITAEQSGNFNAGVAVEEVSKLLGEQKISNEAGPVSTLVLQGLDNFANSYYKWAITQFKQAVQQSPVLQDDLAPLIAEAEQRVTNGQDNTPVLTLGKYYLHKGQLWIVVILVCGLGIIGLLMFIMLIITLRRRGQHKTYDLPVTNPPPANSSPEPAPASSDQPHRLSRIDD